MISYICRLLKAGLLQSNVVREEESHPAVTDLCTIDGGNIVAVAIQRYISACTASYYFKIDYLFHH